MSVQVLDIREVGSGVAQPRREGVANLIDGKGFRQRLQHGSLFVVVTRQDAAWSPVSDQPESYALAIVPDDRQRAEADLYAEVRAELQARARVRIQV